MDQRQEPPIGQAPRRGRWKRRVLALALGLGLPLVAAEVAVRATLGSPLAERLPIVEIQANAFRGWEMIPGQTHYTYHNAVHVNGLGLRGAELAPKGEGQRRVLALGDSLIYGQGVGDEETLPAYLEGILNDTPAGKGGTWDVVNAGHRAYDTRQELGLLEELGDAIEPDVVVLFWFWNDIHERDIKGTQKRLQASGPIFFDTGNRLEGSDRMLWQAKQFLRRSALVMALWDLLSVKQTQPSDQAYIDAAFGRLDTYMESFLSLASKRDFELLFAPIPEAGSLLGPHPSDALLERAVAHACAMGIGVIDLKPGLQALAKGLGCLPVIPFDGHYLPAANAVMANAVAEALR